MGFRIWGLNSLKRVIWEIIWGSAVGVMKGDARSLDYSSFPLNITS